MQEREQASMKALKHKSYESDYEEDEDFEREAIKNQGHTQSSKVLKKNDSEVQVVA